MLHMMAVHDKYDLFHSFSAEHLSRRMLQQLRAVRTNPKSPDFSALASYMRHAEEAFGIVPAPTFDKYVTGREDAGPVLEAGPLYREENTSDKKRKDKKKGKGDQKGDKGDGTG